VSIDRIDVNGFKVEGRKGGTSQCRSIGRWGGGFGGSPGCARARRHCSVVGFVCIFCAGVLIFLEGMEMDYGREGGKGEPGGGGRQ
jgi:hypothetical protein